ncbi:MAG: hypothetical protein NTW29_18855 [Bacteroidetes bacterium]|nr:hypothetical protein [Bacteroidota bacterium]
MKTNTYLFSSAFITCFFFGLSKPYNSPDTAKAAPQEKVIFAVINNGKMIEPIVRVVDGKLVPAYSNEENAMTLPAFTAMYYKPKSSYALITGGKSTGNILIKKNDPSWECTPMMAEVMTTSPKVRLKGFEMALATNITPAKTASGLRRAATPAEKAMIDKLVSAEFKKNNCPVKSLKAVKLTILDADNDKKNEIVGTYTVTPGSNERGLLFFIASKNETGVYELQVSEFNRLKKDEVMSGNISDVDDGIYQEMLLDILDTDNSGVAKIFTTQLSFEGVGYNVYQRNGSKWERAADLSYYHCGY